MYVLASRRFGGFVLVSRSFVLAAIGVLFASVSAQNLVLNGDFEALSIGNSVPGTPKVEGGWIFENYCGVETNGNPGKSSRLESNGSTSFDPTASQTVSGLQIGETYTIAWDWKLRVNYSGSGTGRSFGVFLDDQTYAGALFFGERLVATYVRSSVSFTATSTSHTVIFAGELDNRTNGGAGNTDVSYNLDNVELSAVPEPTSLIGLAWGALALRFRKK
ncbi:MAG: hypothetical protein UZ18_ATM001002199 [Armatimonadetes bacterium OLB18]|nr:MAG: hypothetical protein UZ18_ATM001002199 [Armatimonadetes bacterium OLB18]